MKHITFYDPQGRLTGGAGLEDDQYERVKDRLEAHIEGSWSGRTHYLANGVLAQRPENPVELDGLTLRRMPVPCTINIRDADRDGNIPGRDKVYPCDVPEAELGFEHPGRYRVRVECWPYLDKEFIVENPPR